MSLSKQAVLEIQELSSRAETLARGTASQRKQADILCQRISTIKQIGLSTLEIRGLYVEALVEETSLEQRKQPDEAEYRAHFDHYVAGRKDEKEFRDFLAGTQSITYTQGAAGGFAVPFAYDATLREAMAQTDPVLSDDVTSFSMTPTPRLLPEQISGFDLSTINAQLIGESIQQNPETIPTVLGGVLRSNLIFKASFAASWEAAEDAFDFVTKVIRAGGVALARRIGTSVLTGRGGADISGIVQALGSPSLSNATPGKLTLADLNNVYFAVNRFYRASPKCGWLMTDGAYKYLRNAVDTSGRPLLDVVADTEMLLGKPVLVSPSLASLYSSIGLQGAILFGDLSSIVVRTSRPEIQRSTQAGQADISQGRALWIARCRADASYFDPSSGSNPPLVLCAIN